MAKQIVTKLEKVTCVMKAVNKFIVLVMQAWGKVKDNFLTTYWPFIAK